MKRLLLLCGLAGVIFVAGCSGSSSSSGPSATNETGGSAPAGEKVKIGFIVKSMADSWFQGETKFAKDKAAELGVELIVQEAKDGSAVMTAIDSMATNGCQGLIICSPEVQLGPAIKAATDRHKMKLMSVDDRLVGADGKPLTEIPHLGISAHTIGNTVGQAMVDEMKKRGWKPEETAALAIVAPGLETARQRVDGCNEILLKNGFVKANMFEAPWTGAVDVAAASDAANAVLTAQSKFKKWVVCSSNDDGVIGAVRAIQNRAIPVTDIIGVGINGSLAAQEWDKGQPSGIFASVLLQPRIHGGSTVEMMAAWVKDGKEPPKETYTSGTLINKDNYKEEMKKEGL